MIDFSWILGHFCYARCMPCWNQYLALIQLNMASLSYEIFSLMLNIALSILGSFKLERDKGGNSRACSWCTRKASIKTCASYWLCQPFSIHGENYSICKFHLSWNVGHWKKLFRQFLWLTCLCFLAAWCSYASPLFLSVELIVVFLVYFLMQDSWILEKQLDLISNSTIFWTDYGLRSLSKTRWMFYLFLWSFYF